MVVDLSDSDQDWVKPSIEGDQRAALSLKETLLSFDKCGVYRSGASVCRLSVLSIFDCCAELKHIPSAPTAQKQGFHIICIKTRQHTDTCESQQPLADADWPDFFPKCQPTKSRKIGVHPRRELTICYQGYNARQAWRALPDWRMGCI